MKYLEFKILNPKYQIIHTKKRKKKNLLLIYLFFKDNDFNNFCHLNNFYTKSRFALFLFDQNPLETKVDPSADLIIQ